GGGGGGGGAAAGLIARVGHRRWAARWLTSASPAAGIPPWPGRGPAVAPAGASEGGGAAGPWVDAERALPVAGAAGRGGVSQPWGWQVGRGGRRRVDGAPTRRIARASPGGRGRRGRRWRPLLSALIL